MKYLVSDVGRTLLWHTTQAIALLLGVLVVFERLVPGAVLGHVPLFAPIPLLLLLIALQPKTTKIVRWWHFFDLWMIGFLIIGRLTQVLNDGGPLGWILAGLGSLLVVVFLATAQEP